MLRHLFLEPSRKYGNLAGMVIIWHL